MSNPRVSEHQINKQGMEALQLAMLTLEIVMDGHVLAVVGEDRRGCFVFFCPGREAEIARKMGQFDWAGAARVAEEHIP